MKDAHNKLSKGSSRGWVRRLMSSWLKPQTCGCRKDTQKILEKLESIEASIDILAREVARWTKSGK